MINTNSNNSKSSILVFITFLSIFLLFSNGKITTSMDVDVVRYAQNLVDTGTFGSDLKLSGGTVYSPKTNLFYPMEGIGVVIPVAIMSYISKLFSIESTFLIFSTGAIFFALTFMFMYKLFLLFVSQKKALLYSGILGLATPVFVLSKMLFPEPFVMFAISGSLYYFFKSFYSADNKNKNINLFLTGLFTSLTLLMRPDAPIFYGLVFILVFIRLLKENNKIIKLTYFGVGILIFTLTFSIVNYSKFGSILETGYGINKSNNRETVLNSLNKDIKTLPTRINEVLVLAKKSVSIDEKSEESQKLILKYQTLTQSLKQKQDYKKELEEKKNFKVNGILANKGDEGIFSIVSDYLYGVVLIVIYPNRSILFFSPILLLLFFGIKQFYRKYKAETVIFALIFFLYLSLFALRAPYGYSGTAAWGVRYMLPMYLIIGLLFIGYDKFFNELSLDKKKKYKIILISLFSISLIFQIIGSSISYQHVQMPLEQIITQKYGKENISRSRIELMTKPNCSLLLNNFQLLTGSVPQVLRNHLSEVEIKQYSSYFAKQSGPNDWFFYDLLKDGPLTNKLKNKGSYKFLLFVLLTSLVGSILLLAKLQRKNE